MSDSGDDDTLYAVYGAAGCGRGIMPLARATLAAAGWTPARLSERLVFVDRDPAAARVNGQRVLTREQFLASPASRHMAAIAIADGAIRARLFTECATDGVEPWTIIATSAVIMDDVTIGAGALISPFVTITSNIRIGRAFHANIASIVEHDCVIGDFVTFAPGVRCNGTVTVEDHAYVGAGALIRQGKPGVPLTIGTGAVVGMGAVVTKSVAAGVTVVGSPARPLVKTIAKKD